MTWLQLALTVFGPFILYLCLWLSLTKLKQSELRLNNWFSLENPSAAANGLIAAIGLTVTLYIVQDQARRYLNELRRQTAIPFTITCVVESSSPRVESFVVKNPTALSLEDCAVEMSPAPNLVDSKGQPILFDVRDMQRVPVACGTNEFGLSARALVERSFPSLKNRIAAQLDVSLVQTGFRFYYQVKDLKLDPPRQYSIETLTCP